MGFRLAAGAAAVCLTATLVPARLTAVAPGSIDVVVQDRAGVPSATLGGALAAAASVFGNAGVRLAWLDNDRARCASALPRDAPARRAFFEALFAIRIVERPAAGQHHGAPYILGIAPVGTRVATVFHRRVEQHARDGGLDPGVVLGHVIAHELGHLLLGRASHSVAGVMRSVIDAPLAAQKRLRFTADEASTIVARATGQATCESRPATP